MYHPKPRERRNKKSPKPIPCQNFAKPRPCKNKQKKFFKIISKQKKRPVRANLFNNDACNTYERRHWKGQKGFHIQPSLSIPSHCLNTI